MCLVLTIGQTISDCAYVAIVRRINKTAQFFFNIAFSAALLAATAASVKHFVVKVIKYFAVLCNNAAVTIKISNCNFLKLYAFSNLGIGLFCFVTILAFDRRTSRQTDRQSNKTLKLQLSPGLVASYDIQPGNGVGLFWGTKHTHIFTYLLTYLLTFPGHSVLLRLTTAEKRSMFAVCC